MAGAPNGRPVCCLMRKRSSLPAPLWAVVAWSFLSAGNGEQRSTSVDVVDPCLNEELQNQVLGQIGPGKENPQTAELTWIKIGPTWSQPFLWAWPTVVAIHSLFEWPAKGIFNIFLIILQNYTFVSKFINFDNQPSCVLAAAVGHGGWGLFVVRYGGRSNRCSPRQ
jgi:hypothetical protein